MVQAATAFRPEIIFFLGAGASVKAGVPDTYRLTEDFRSDPTLDAESRANINEMLEILSAWKKRTDPENPRVDIELVLEALDRLQSNDHDLLLQFYDHPRYLLPGYPEKGVTIKTVRDYIKRRAVVKRNSVGYLQPFLGFLRISAPLDVFSVNYDIVVEQFCSLHKKQLSDGFESEWDQNNFVKSNDFRLYKLHGSVTWYKTEHADYVKVPILTGQEIELITGEKASPLILYPMRKWEYDEPLLALLMILKERLQTARFCIVVGYSFRDEHITRIIWDAARRNPYLNLIIISPNSPRTYERKLKYYERSVSPPIPSSLEGRVITLPYRFEDIFSDLQDKIVRPLRNALRMETDARSEELAQVNPNWTPAVGQFIEAEHYEKVVEILGRTPWDSLRLAWTDRVQYAFRMWFLSCVRHDAKASEQFAARFQDAISSFDTDKMVAFIDNNAVAIGFRFSPPSTVSTRNVSDAIQPLLDYSGKRAKMVDEPLKSVIGKAHNALQGAQSYLLLWGDSSMGIRDYYNLREPTEMLSRKFDETMTLRASPAESESDVMEPARKAVEAIEKKHWTDLMISLRSTVAKCPW